VITATDLIGELDWYVSMIKAQTQGLSHADKLLQLPFRGNCLNWLLSHRADDRYTMPLLLGGEAILSEAQASRYRCSSEPVCADGGDILTLEQLLTVLERDQRAQAASLDKIRGPPRLLTSSSFCTGTRATTSGSPSTCGSWPARTPS
jgi:hypothetical protein